MTPRVEISLGAKDSFAGVGQLLDARRNPSGPCSPGQFDTERVAPQRYMVRTLMCLESYVKFNAFEGEA